MDEQLGRGNPGEQSDEDSFSQLWDLGKTDPETCRQQVKAWAGRLRGENLELSMKLLALHGLTILSQFPAKEDLVERLPQLSASERISFADLCEEGLAFILADWQVQEWDPEFWATKIIDQQLGKFAIFLTELRPGRAEQMIAERMSELPPDLVEMLDVGIADDWEWVFRIVGRHASQAPAKGTAERLQNSFASLSQVASAVTSGGLSSSKISGLMNSLNAALAHIDEALAQDPQGVFYGLAFSAFRAFALIYKGELLRLANRSEEGLKLIQEAVQLIPGSFNARAGLVESLRAVGRMDEAQAQLTELSRLAVTDDQRQELKLQTDQLSRKPKRKGFWR